MESFLSRYKNALVLIIVLLAQVVGLAVQVRRPAADGSPDAEGVRLIRYWVISVIAPPERLLHLGGGGIRGLWNNYLDLVHVRQQNRDLQIEINRLRVEQGSVMEDVRQARRLQALLEFRQHYLYKTVPAQVVGTSGTDQSRTLLLDKGSHDGIRANMAVITPDGIVGKIREVFPSTSQVLEISDQTSGAGVILANTRIRGILRGNATGQPQIINVSADDRIKPGEPIVTTGGDRIFPRGLPVGTVAGVVHDPESTFISIAVTPGANLASLEEVLIITETGDQMPAQEQQDLSEGATAAANQRAADVLSQRLPSRVDPNAPPATAPDPAHPVPPADPNGVPAPIRAPAAIHADKFSPGAVPPATSLTPGERLTEPAPTAQQPVRRVAPPESDGAADRAQPAVPKANVPKPVTPGASTSKSGAQRPAGAAAGSITSTGPASPASKPATRPAATPGGTSPSAAGPPKPAAKPAEKPPAPPSTVPPQGAR